MKTISLRSLSREAPTITEAVLVQSGRVVIGTFTPINAEPYWPGGAVPAQLVEGPWKEKVMEEPVKKAIEPEKVKSDRGKLTKGLGDIPRYVGNTDEPETMTRVDTFGKSRPAPKPGKK